VYTDTCYGVLGKLEMDKVQDFFLFLWGFMIFIGFDIFFVWNKPSVRRHLLWSIMEIENLQSTRFFCFFFCCFICFMIFIGFYTFLPSA
jgi:hypothetical protein